MCSGKHFWSVQGLHIQNDAVGSNLYITHHVLFCPPCTSYRREPVLLMLHMIPQYTENPIPFVTTRSSVYIIKT